MIYKLHLTYHVTTMIFKTHTNTYAILTAIFQVNPG